MDSPIARSLISSLAFRSLTSGVFNFFRVGICFYLTLEARESSRYPVHTYYQIPAAASFPPPFGQDHRYPRLA